MTRLPLFLILLLLTPGCAKKLVAGKAAEAEESSDDTLRFERLAAGQLDDGDRAAEARAWLDAKNTKNVLWKTSRADTLKFVNDLYQAGALKVYAIYAPKDDTVPVNMCAELFLELPKDSMTRARVIKTFNRIEKRIWGDDHTPAKDEGQKFLYLNMDP